MSMLRGSMFLLAVWGFAACATSSTPDEGTGTVGGGGHVDGGNGTPDGGPDDGGTSTDAGIMTSDSGIVIADSSPTDTGTVATGHIECPTTDDAGATTYAYANEYINNPTTTACTMGGPECVAYTECCFIDLCVQYPAP